MSNTQRVVQALKEGNRVSCVYNSQLLSDIRHHMNDHYKQFCIQVDISEGFMRLKMIGNPVIKRAGSIHGKIQSLTAQTKTP
jgi:hypothetical protein